MTNVRNTNPDNSLIKEALEKIREKAREEVEKIKTLKDEVKKIMDEQQSLSEQISNDIEQATNKESKWDKIFDLDNPRVKAIKKMIEQEQELKKLAEKYANDPEKKDLANALVKMGLTSDSSTDEGGWLYETLGDAGSIFKDELTKSLADFENFGDGMKALGNEIAQYMIKQGVDALSQIVVQSLQASKIIHSISAGNSEKSNTASNIFGSITSAISTFFGAKKHHSGGVILPSSGTLPGTQEQIAMLKGGERVLSPAETTSYNSEDSASSQPVVFVNNNIKAWDSKDVKQYLLDNASLINSITAQGIRDNKHYLRTMIRNA